MIKLSQEANDLIAAAGIDNERDEVIGWFADEWRGGALQAYCNEQELEAGEHYNRATQFINDALAFAITEYIKGNTK
tara:strand:- start:43 stop:273 length:231 start_codon:yes stop_codon:yes gene_type:complete